MLVDDAAVEVTGSALIDNEDVDVDLRFGARASFEDDVVGTLVCGEDVRVRGDQSCSLAAP